MKPKILHITSFYTDFEYKSVLQESDLIPLNHLWGYDNFIKAGYDISVVQYNKNSFLNKIGLKLGIDNLLQQINCIKIASKDTIIYVPASSHGTIIYLFKYFGLLRNTKILSISHGAYNVKFNKFRNKFRQIVEKFAFEHGVDIHVFLNKVIFESYLKSFKKKQEFNKIILQRF